LVFCSPSQVSYSYVHGRAVIREGHLVGVDLPKLIEQHNRASLRMVNGD
jgi:hypothetical protein